jgi:fructose-1-phosphate kinase PfkB-like protein
MNFRTPATIAMTTTTTATTTSSSSYPTVIVVGLNGALQKRFILPDHSTLVAGNVHRASTVRIGVGGKGQDVAIALRCLEPCQGDLHLAQFVGSGSTGDTVHQLLVDRLGISAMDLSVRVTSEMRTCTSIVATDETTELVEPSGIISEMEISELMTKINNFKNLAGAICIMGSMPPGCPPELYSEIFRILVRPDSICVVDSLTGIDEIIRTANEMEIGAGRIILKINSSELCNLAGTSKSRNETGGIIVSELTDAIYGFLQQYSWRTTKSLLGLAITDGRHPAYFVCMTGVGISPQPIVQIFKLAVAKLESSLKLYPIGAGDAVAAGTLAGWVSLVQNVTTITSTSTIPSSSVCPIVPSECLEILIEHSNGLCSDYGLAADVAKVVSAFALGLACGSASCLLEENSALNPTDVKNLFRQARRPELILSLPFGLS